jgi:tRNA threonylcarbamoyl adenosine modification protein YeaZ
MVENSQIILAVETSSRALSVAVGRRSKPKEMEILCELFLNTGFQHAEKLKGFCQQALNMAGLSLNDVAALACSTGPGSFTGLRVGVSFVRALAQYKKLPVIGVSTLQVLRCPLSSSPRPLSVVVDSIGDEFFAAFTAKDKGRLYRQTDLIKILRGQKNPLVLGPGRAKLNSFWPCPDEGLDWPRAANVLNAAIKYNIKPRPWAKLLPEYLRPPIAVERAAYRKKKEV